MNRTRSVLIAVSILLAMAFTVSCSGDDGSDGQQGNPGTSCFVEDKNTHFEIKCENYTTPVEVAKIEWCGANPYNPAIHSCWDSVVYGQCNVKITPGGSEATLYRSSIQFCNSNNEVKPLCDGQDYSPTQYCSNGVRIKTYGSMTYDGQTYKTVNIGTQVWMAENLNYDVEGSKCWGEDGQVLQGDGSLATLLPAEVQANCTKYGRLYDWATAMDLPPDCNSSECENLIQSKHRGICPEHWHLPSEEEWQVLIDYIGGKSIADVKLSVYGGDNYGFSAHPTSGSYDSFNGYYPFLSGWWSSSNAYESYAFLIQIYEYSGLYTQTKLNLFSVRCLANSPLY